MDFNTGWLPWLAVEQPWSALAGSMGNSLYIQFNRPFPINEASLACDTT